MIDPSSHDRIHDSESELEEVNDHKSDDAGLAFSWGAFCLEANDGDDDADKGGEGGDEYKGSLTVKHSFIIAVNGITIFDGEAGS